MAKDLATVEANWLARSQASGQAFIDGVNNTTVDPTQRAIAAQAALLAGFNQAVTSGRWANNLARVGKGGWQTATVAKAGNYATGIAAGAGKYNAAMSTWYPRILAAAAAAKSMPGGSIGASNARSAAFATALYNAKRGL